MMGIFWVCSARAPIGHPVAAPPRTPRNSRRRMSAPDPGDGIVAAQSGILEGLAMSALGQKQTWRAF
jgi:hypothetical protein